MLLGDNWGDDDDFCMSNDTDLNSVYMYFKIVINLK